MAHVFISYVRENANQVQRLANDLMKNGIRVWLDKNEIKPGSRWKDAIKEAINKGDFFIAYFSVEYWNRNKSYMNEELLLAIDELRQYQTSHIWFIPVLLSKCNIPPISIGAGQTLNDLHWVKLFEDWEGGIKRIIAVINQDVNNKYKLNTKNSSHNNEAIYPKSFSINKRKIQDKLSLILKNHRFAISFASFLQLLIIVLNFKIFNLKIIEIYLYLNDPNYSHKFLLYFLCSLLNLFIIRFIQVKIFRYKDNLFMLFIPYNIAPQGLWTLCMVFFLPELYSGFIYFGEIYLFILYFPILILENYMFAHTTEYLEKSY